MPLYDFRCKKCKKEFEGFSVIAEKDNQTCECGGKAETIITPMRNGLDPFKPYVLENGVENPVLITSRQHRDQVFKENKVDQLPYKKQRCHPYSRIFPVSGPCSKGTGTRWTGAGLSY